MPDSRSVADRLEHLCYALVLSGLVLGLVVGLGIARMCGWGNAP